MTPLRRLDIRENPLADDGVDALARVLARDNHVLVELCLRDVGVTSSTIQALAEVMWSNKVLHVDLTGNPGLTRCDQDVLLLICEESRGGRPGRVRVDGHQPMAQGADYDDDHETSQAEPEAEAVHWGCDKQGAGQGFCACFGEHEHDLLEHHAGHHSQQAEHAERTHHPQATVIPEAEAAGAPAVAV
jgi:hypothetical protein